MLINSLLVKLGFEADESPLTKVQEHLEGIEHKLGFLAGAEIVKGLFELGEKFGAMGEQIQSAAISAGLTSEAFQKLSFAASQNAVNDGELSQGLARLNRTLYQARNGSEQAQKAFEDVGITPEQIAGFHNSGDAFKALADKIRGIEDPVKRQAAAVALLGRGSYTMVKLLAQGGDGITKFGESAEAMGAVVSDEGVEKLEELEDTISGLFKVLQALMMTITAEFGPAIIDVVHDIEDFYKANQKLIKFNLTSWLDEIAYALGWFSADIIKVTKVVFDFINAHPQLVKWVGKAVLALGGLSFIASLATGSVGILARWFKNIAGLIKLAGEALHVFQGIGSTAISVVVRSLVLMQGALVAVAEYLAAALATTFPALSAWLTSLATLLTATPLGVFAAALAAVVLTGQALYTYLTGGNVEDMWIVQLLNKIMAIPAALKGVYQSLKGRFFGKGEPNAPNIKSTGLQLDDDASGLAGAVGMGSAGISVAQQMTQPSVALPAQTLDFGGNAGVAGQGYTLNAPVTINTGSSLTSDQAYKAVQEAAGDHFDRQVRDLMRSQQTAVVH